MRLRHKIILVTVAGLITLSWFSCWLYATLSAETQMIWLFYLIVVSAWTSFFGVAWALYGIWKFDTEVEKAKKQLNPDQLIADLKKEWDEIKPFFVWLKENRESFKRIIAGVDRLVGKFERPRPMVSEQPSKQQGNGQ